MTYPTLTLPKGVAWGYRKTPKFQTIIQTPQSGRGQVRASLQQSPVYEWDLSWNYLKENGVTTANDFLYLQDFFNAVNGSFGSFIFDPSQYSFERLSVVSNTAQLNNGFSGVAPGMNYLAWSSTFNESATWVPNQIGSITANQLAPDGSMTAFELTAASGATDAWVSQGVAAFNSTGWTATLSVYLAGSTGQTIDIQIHDSAGNSVTTCTLAAGGGWQRFSVTRTNLAGAVSVFIGSNSTFTSGQHVYAAWAQIEVGTTANAYVSTLASAVPGQTTFQLWRSSAVFNSSTVTQLEMIQNISFLSGIYVNGTLQSSGSYTQANFPATVTFNSPPSAGSTVVWAGNYNYLVHFAEDSNEFSQFMFELWELKTLKLEEVQL